MSLTAEGQVLLRLRRPWRDGTRAIRFEPSELLEKLAAPASSTATAKSRSPRVSA